MEQNDEPEANKEGEATYGGGKQVQAETKSTDPDKDKDKKLNDGSDRSSALMLLNLNREVVTSAVLRSFFSAFGECEIVYKEGANHGIVKMGRQDEAEKVGKALNGEVLWGSPVTIIVRKYTGSAKIDQNVGNITKRVCEDNVNQMNSSTKKFRKNDGSDHERTLQNWQSLYENDSDSQMDNSLFQSPEELDTEGLNVSLVQLQAENILVPKSQGEADQGSYDYDVIVIGGGAGGLAASKEASALGAKVACLDFVKPSPKGTTWGLGGTSINVGCIPKKLMHQAALLGHDLDDARKFGWVFENEVKHNWQTMTNAVQEHIKYLQWRFKKELEATKVTCFNAFAEFVGPNRIKSTDAKGKVKEMTSKYFIIATGGRPKYPEIPGMKEYCISSDDLFSLPYCPGKTLVIGASYVSLECAGFLKALGLDVTVMVRSILLRGFDQQMAELIGTYMQKEGIKFVRPCVPTKVEKLEEGKPGRYRVTASMADDGTEVVEEYNTVILAIGRDPCTSELHLENVGVKVNPMSGYVICGEDESTTCPYIYGVGDIIEGKPRFTPVAIQAGKLLAKRLFGGATLKCDYENVPTTVFTPLEYGCVGLSEEDALAKYGAENVKVYHSTFTPLEWTLTDREDDDCYAKLVCVTSEEEIVVGLHVLGPHAGEITQGWTIGIKLGATKADFDNVIGIHPTCAEVFTTLNGVKGSGVEAAGCAP